MIESVMMEWNRNRCKIIYFYPRMQRCQFKNCSIPIPIPLATPIGPAIKPVMGFDRTLKKQAGRLTFDAL